MNRRHFLMGSAAAIGVAASSCAAPGARVRIACVGIGGRGQNHLNGFSALPNVEIAAVCDVDQSHLDRAVQVVEKASGKKPKTYVDIRKLLEDKSIDAVSIASPNHWHTLMTVWACQAGKDVYVEKPCSHDIFEARQIVAAARKYNRIVEQGSQFRSSASVQEAMRKMREGLIGDVYLARGLSYKWRGTIGRSPVSPVPPGVDYDLWTGPAPKRDFTRNRFHYNWHWFWDTGNGEIGNQAIHQLDVARWGLGVKYPVKVSAIGGHFLFDDDQETPNNLNCAFEFNDNGKRLMMEVEVRNWISNHEADIKESPDPNTIGDIFYGSKGYLAVDTYMSYRSWLGRDQKPGPQSINNAATANDSSKVHYSNFIEAVRSRKRESLTAEIEEGAASTVLLHLANISYRVGRTINFDPKTLTITGDPQATSLMSREYRKPFVLPDLTSTNV